MGVRPILREASLILDAESRSPGEGGPGVLVGAVSACASTRWGTTRSGILRARGVLGFPLALLLEPKLALVPFATPRGALAMVMSVGTITLWDSGGLSDGTERSP